MKKINDQAGLVDIGECEDCVAFGEPCPYHVGFADGWDCAASTVGALVLDQRSQSCR